MYFSTRLSERQNAFKDTLFYSEEKKKKIFRLSDEQDKSTKAFFVSKPKHSSKADLGFYSFAASFRKAGAREHQHNQKDQKDHL